MVCSECKLAGELNSRGVALREAGNVGKAEETFDAAEAVHERCRGCDCAHMVGVSLVNWPHVEHDGRPA